MKVAIVHELLTVKGGAEKVAKIFADMFPSAQVYTLLYDHRALGDWFPNERVRAARYGFPQNALFGRAKFNHHLYLNAFADAVESWDFSDYDLVISSSSAFAHGIITNGKPKHLCYVHSPARYLWDRTHDVATRAGEGLLGPLKKRLFERTAHTLRMWDCEAAYRPDTLIAASHEVKRRIELYWRRESAVVHPPIADEWYAPCSAKGAREHPEYFLIVSTLARYKRIDIAIQACNTAKTRLIIVGEGPDRERLEKLAGPTIAFYGHRSGDELKDLYADAKAVIFPGLEDFGMVPVESMASGTPVIAFRGGGALESVTEGITGEFFDEPTEESLLGVVQKFEQKKYSKETLRAAAAPYKTVSFIAAMHSHIDELMRS